MGACPCQGRRKSKYLGGAAAVANHLSSFCNKVNFISYVGEKDSFFIFIKKKLNNKISSDFLIRRNSPTILKKRYIDQVSGTKLLGVYNTDDIYEDKKKEAYFFNKLKKISKKSELLIISDYDHGLISPKGANQISRLKNLKTEFAKSFKKANTIILCPLYKAGESIKLGFSYKSFAKLIAKDSNVNLITIKNELELKKVTNNLAFGNKIFIAMGAGSISNWVRNLN